MSQDGLLRLRRGTRRRGSRLGRGSGATGGIAAMLAVAASAGLVGLAVPIAAAAAAPAKSSRTQTLCSVLLKQQHQALNPWAYVDGQRYRVQDDRFGSQDPRQCVTLTPGGRPAWRVSVSRAHSRGNPVQAFPYIEYGCYWGYCTPGSVLPLQVSNLKTATSAWYTQERASGTWNAGYDLWLNSTRLPDRGHADRAEVMIWLHATMPHYRVGGLVGTRKVKVAGRWFYLTHWRTGANVIPGGWQYVQYRLAAPTWHARKMNIAAVLADAVRRHLISRSWYLQGIIAGDEIWSGGQGLATTWFAAAVTPRHRVKALPASVSHAASVPGVEAPPVPVWEPVGP
ncbi:MAG TPA: hypothetical protein VMV07_11885 [Streptosporangiaceae bacterium]|nr:hypothetical protein [Streptosporangiaceae bacterium]